MFKATLLFTFLQGVVNTEFATPSNQAQTHLPQSITKFPPSCNSKIYCYGRLLNTVQMSSIFTDSKTFVDLKMKENSDKTLESFDKFMESKKNKPTRLDIKTFLDEHFEPAGSEFENWSPIDWHDKPKFLQKINDRELRKWASNLHSLWKLLGRKMKNDVAVNSDLYSIIYVPHPVIVPGGRFREFYYWDSYWIIRGLLLSEMHVTVKGMLENFVSIIKRYGFIPNGGRIYYLKRSQPPLFIPMVDSYLEATNDVTFIKNNIKYIEQEFQFWQENHSINVIKNGKVYTLFRYRDESSGPRPESYREDVLTALSIKESDKDAFYSELKTAAESGWDFSTRWFVKSGSTNTGNLTDIKIKSIIPVDLNAILYWNAQLLAKYFRLLNIPDKAEMYDKIAENLLEAVTAILWHPEIGVWLDWDTLNNVKRDFFYPSNLAPLWTNCYYKDKVQYFAENVMRYLDKSTVLNYLGGIPTSLEQSGEQWDYPNAWPPLQHMIIIGLDNTNHSKAQKIAWDLADKWIRSNYAAYKDSGAMFEKYDATIMGGHGGGGEYEVQLGFGWTNGVILDLLDRFAEVIDEDLSNNKSALAQTKPATNQGVITAGHPLGPAFTLVLAFSATLTAALIGTIVYTKRQTPQRPDKSRYKRLPGTPN